MLNALRNLAKTTVAKLLMTVLVLSFGAWGIHGVVNNVDPTEVARAGDTVVTVREFDRSLDAAKYGFTERQQRAPSDMENRAIAGEVLQNLVADALQVDAAKALGVDISDEAVAGRIRAAPEFSGANGFDPARYRRFLEQSRTPERDFVATERARAIQEIWVNSLVGGVTAPASYLEAINRYANQTRTVTTFTLTDDALGPIPDPSEAARRAYYDANKAEFRSPERRTFSVLSLSAEALADPAAVSADAVRKAYDVPGAYGAPDRRTVEQVFSADRAALQAAADAFDRGDDPAAVFTTLGTKADDASLGSVARADILNPEVADAAFALDAGKARVVDTRFGPTLVRVEAIAATGKQPFETAEPLIRKSLALDDAVDQARSLETSVLDEIAGGSQVEDVGKRFGLPVAAVTGVDRDGATEDGTKPDVPGGAKVLGSAFAQTLGSDAAEVHDGDATYFVELTSVEQPKDLAYEDVEGGVVAAWTLAEKKTRLEALAAEAVKALSAGASPDEVAARYGAIATTSAPFSRAKPAADLPSGVVEAAFSGPAGHAGSIAAGPNAVVVYAVTGIEEPVFYADAPDLAGIRRNLDEGIANAVVFDAMNAWQREVGANINQQLADAVASGAQR